MAGLPKGRTNNPAGRPKGSKNKVKADIEQKLAALGCDPIQGMAEIAIEAKNNGDFTLAGSMYKELAQYVAPKRKAVEVSGEGGGPVEFAWAKE